MTQDRGLTKTSFSLGGLLGKNMALIGLVSLTLPVPVSLNLFIAPLWDFILFFAMVFFLPVIC